MGPGVLYHGKVVRSRRRLFPREGAPMLVLIAVTTAVLFFVSVNQVLVRLWTRAASGGFAHGLPRRSSRCLTGKIQCCVSKHDGGSPWPDDEGSEACVLIHW
jgi:hypothetical protein